MTIEACVFAGIGTLAECAEIDRQAWNASFRAHGIDWDWDWQTYAKLVGGTGAWPLVTRYMTETGTDPGVAPELVHATHQRLFASRLSGSLPLRPGVGKVLNWSYRAGLKLGLVSRSGTAPVRALLQATARARAGIGFDVAELGGDVERLVPDPQAMQRAVGALGVGRTRVVVVADTAVAAHAAQAAGLTVLGFPGAIGALDRTGFGEVETVSVLSPEAIARAWHGRLDTAAE